RGLRGREACCGIRRGDLWRERAVPPRELRLVLGLGRDGRRADEEEVPLVGVRAEQVRHAREGARVEERARLVGEEAAVHDRLEGERRDHAAARREVREERGGRKLAETGELVGGAAAADRSNERRGRRGPFRGRRLARRTTTALADPALEELPA